MTVIHKNLYIYIYIIYIYNIIVISFAKFIATVLLLLSKNNFNVKEATLPLMLKKQWPR